MPRPQAFALLGRVYRVSYRAPTGGLVQYCWGREPYKSDVDFRGEDRRQLPGRAPQLLWAEDVRALYIFPGYWVASSAFRKVEAPPRARRTLALFNEWDHHAKAPDVRTAVPDYPQPSVAPAGSAYDIVYRSEKWNGRKGAEHDYRHHFSSSGRVGLALDAAKPTGILISGGRLTVNDRGIVY